MSAMQLNQFVQENETAQAVLQSLTARTRNRKEINLTRMEYFLTKEGKFVVDHNDLIRMFKGMEEAKLGQLIVGRNGKEYRFRSNVNITNLDEYLKGRRIDVPTSPEVTPKGLLTAPVEAPKRDKNGRLLTKDGKVDQRQFGKGRPKGAAAAMVTNVEPSVSHNGTLEQLLKIKAMVDQAIQSLPVK